MRGLDVRVQYARAKIAEIAGDQGAVQLLWDAEDEAHNEGYRDFKNKVFDAPRLLSDVPVLLRGWNSGQAEATNEQLDAYLADEEYSF